MEHGYDFIIVGAGTSGCVLASRLAESPGKPSVLLLEAGGNNDDAAKMSGEDRFKIAFEPNSPLNWGFKTTPQEHLNGQQIDYSRGKGLGGSTAINFCGWNFGADADADEWARLVHDDAFNWENTRRALKKIETFHPEVPPGFDSHIKPKVEDRGTDGPVHVSYTDKWFGVAKDLWKAAEESGLGLSSDNNGGNPLGMGIGQVCIHDGLRITSSSAYLAKVPENLTIQSEAHIASIILKGKAATGVSTVGGREYRAKKEVIVSCGSLSTPQLLLVSGIGPIPELERHGIEPLHDLPQVGRHLQDHACTSVGIVVKKKVYGDGWVNQKPTPMGWFKSEVVLSSDEFRDLPQDIRTYLKRSTVPTWELAAPAAPSQGLSIALSYDESYIGGIALNMNPQSKGTVTLGSANPLDPPVIDPRFLTHPYDRRVLIESVRDTMKFFSTPIFKSKTLRTVSWPEDDSDEAIWDYIKKYLGSCYHMCGTVRMGVEGEEACVDSSFKVFGLERLRVVDLSVCPLVPNCHTQSTAYIVGEIAAEKLIQEYHLSV